MDRTIERFRKKVIVIHWLNVIPFVVLVITGAIMFFSLTTMHGGGQTRVIHKVFAAIWLGLPVVYAVWDPAGARNFLREAFRWTANDLTWLKNSMGYYAGKVVQMPRQGYLNGDQRLWQVVVVIGGALSMATGIAMWFFKFKMPPSVYQGLQIIHVVAFFAIGVTFLAHFYLTTLQNRYGESLASMVDGKISESYAQDHYTRWYEEKPKPVE